MISMVICVVITACLCGYCAWTNYTIDIVCSCITQARCDLMNETEDMNAISYSDRDRAIATTKLLIQKYKFDFSSVFPRNDVAVGYKGLWNL